MFSDRTTLSAAPALGLAASLLLTACGGGGGGGSTPAVAAAPQTLASTTPPASFDFSSVRSRTLRLPDVASASFLASAQSRGIADGRLYVSLWYVDAAGSRQQLAFLTVAVMRGLDAQGGVRVQAPAGAARVYAEVYGQDPVARTVLTTGVQEFSA